MCDTMIATPDATDGGIMIFAKNSDREVNEAQYPVIIPAAQHPPGSSLKCTYIEIPQAAETNRILLSKPFWIWGGEMGTNEHGLTIGNEAVFTKKPYEKEAGLIGMDLLRLALERTAAAEDAVRLITDLLTEYGQGGNCGFNHKLEYHNSFIICDPEKAWLLETAGRSWAAKEIKGVYAISNGLTMDGDWNTASKDLEDERNKKGENFSFRYRYSDFLYTRFSDSRRRRCRAEELLKDGPVDLFRMVGALRDHYDESVNRRLTGASLCNHAGFGPVRTAQTAASMVSLVRRDLPLHLITASAAACTSIFKPVWLDSGLPDLGNPGGRADDSFFWRHERLHRAALRKGFAFKEERDRIEKRIISEALELTDGAGRGAFTEKVFSETIETERNWLKKTEGMPDRPSGLLYRRAWRSFNRKAGLHPA